MEKKKDSLPPATNVIYNQGGAIPAGILGD